MFKKKHSDYLQSVLYNLPLYLGEVLPSLAIEGNQLAIELLAKAKQGKIEEVIEILIEMEKQADKQKTTSN